VIDRVLLGHLCRQFVKAIIVTKPPSLAALSAKSRTSLVLLLLFSFFFQYLFEKLLNCEKFKVNFPKTNKTKTLEEERVYFG